MRHDPLTPKERSERMSRIRGSNTKPEMAIRRLVHSMGYRYRLGSRDVPGKPDLVFRSRRKVIFVHGCFWHQHGCNQYRMPKTRLEFWLPKLNKNRDRDQKVMDELSETGWKALVIWECQIKDISNLADKITSFLEE